MSAVTPISTIPTASADISGSVAASATTMRLAGALLVPGECMLTLLHRMPTGYWGPVLDAGGQQVELRLTRDSATDQLSPTASKALLFQVEAAEKYHVLISGAAAASVSCTIDAPSAPGGSATPLAHASTHISGGGDAIPNAVASGASGLLSGTDKALIDGVLGTDGVGDFGVSNANALTLKANKSLIGAAGTGALTLGSMTGNTSLPTGNLAWAGASTKTLSLAADGAAAVTSAAGALTLTGGAASTLSTTAGAQSVSGFAGVYLKVNGTTVLDVGGTSATAVTLAAGKSLVGAAGAGALTLGSMTGDTTLPTGSISWTAAAAKTLTLSATGAVAITSSGGALTLTAAAASTWSTSGGALSVDGNAGINLKVNTVTLLDLGVTTGTTATLGANVSLAGAAGTGALSLGSMTGNTALPTGSLSWAGANTKTASLVSTGGAITITADAASTWKTSSGALTVDSAAALNLGTVASTGQSAGKSGTTWTFNGPTASGASANTVADPGASGAISVATNGVCLITTAGAETRTLAIPTFVGQRLSVCMTVDGGDCVITVASAFNAAGNTTITLNDAGDHVALEGVSVGGTRAWRLLVNNGATLG